MKAIICAQLNPNKTMKRRISDRNFCRLLILAELAIVWCS